MIVLLGTRDPSWQLRFSNGNGCWFLMPWHSVLAPEFNLWNIRLHNVSCILGQANEKLRKMLLDYAQTRCSLEHNSACKHTCQHLEERMNINVRSVMTVDKTSYTAADDCEVKEMRWTVCHHLPEGLHIQTEVLKKRITT